MSKVKLPKILISPRIVCVSRVGLTYHAVEVGYEDDVLTVYNAAILKQEGSDSHAAQQFKQLLKEKGFKSKTTYASLLSDQVKYQRTSLPELTGKELMAIFKRNIERTHSQPLKNLYHDYKPLRKFTDKKGQTRIEYLNVSVERTHIDAFEDFLVKAGLKPVLISPMNASMSTGIANVRELGDPMPTQVQAYVYISKGLNTISFMQNDWFLFSGEFYISKAVETNAEEEDTETTQLTPQDFHRVSTESSRSIQYFQQNFREYHLKDLVLCGIEIPPWKLLNNLSLVEEGTIKAHQYAESINLNVEEFPDKDEFKDAIGIYSGALSLAMGHAFEKKISFIPAPTIVHKLRYILGAFLILIAVACGMFYNQYSGQIEKVEQQINQAQGKLSSETATLNRLRQEEATRQFYAQVKALIEREIYNTYQLSHVPFKQISQIIPKKVRLNSIDAHLEGNEWKGTLSGVATAKNASSAKKEFERFFDRLKKSPLFKEWEASPLKISTDQQGKTSTQVEFNLKFSLNQLNS